MQVEELEKEKTELESKIEALQHEMEELRNRITTAVNNNEALERQIQEVCIHTHITALDGYSS